MHPPIGVEFMSAYKGFKVVNDRFNSVPLSGKNKRKIDNRNKKGRFFIFAPLTLFNLSKNNFQVNYSVFFSKSQ